MRSTWELFGQVPASPAGPLARALALNLSLGFISQTRHGGGGRRSDQIPVLEKYCTGK